MAMANSKKKHCPACHEGWLKFITVTERIFHEEDGVRLPVIIKNVPLEKCTNCGETFRGPEAARLHHEAVCRTFGFLSPREITDLREKSLRLTQEEFAQLTGIGLATISRWERGRLIQNRAMDRYLRLLRDNPPSVRFLKALSA
jgi:putative zinc finger/helix-turn-helix YgiT family protein